MDGISLLQVADGALQEVHHILQRMNELVVKAANGTYTNSDRSAIQREIDESSRPENLIQEKYFKMTGERQVEMEQRDLLVLQCM